MNNKKGNASTQHFEIAKEWWGEVNDDKGAMAMIRRSKNVLEIIQIPEVLVLVARLGRSFYASAAILAGVLAHVRKDEDERLMRKLGRKDLGDKTARLSETRFRRLIQCDRSDLLDPLRRIVKMNDGAANVSELCRLVLYWNEQIKTDLIFDYYAVTVATPSRLKPDEQPTTTQINPT